MPDVDGLDLARQIKEESNGSGGPGIILLTSTMQVDKAELASAGIREYLTKPVRSSEFYNRLLRLMATKSIGKAGTTLPFATQPESPSVDPELRLGKLLVAEDNEVNQLVARGMANRLGYEVDIVDDGAQAVAATLTGNYAAVLMDCHMPVMDGFEATQTIRSRDSKTVRIPIIAMTAGALNEDRERCFAAGMDDYISKPVDLDKLRDILARWVPQEQRAEAPPSNVVVPNGSDASGPDDADGAYPDVTVLDEDRLQILRELGPADGLGLLPDAIRAFREEAQRALEAIRSGLESGQADAVEAASHKLAGAAGNIGATGAATLAKALERLGREAVPGFEAHGTHVFEELKSELARVDGALERTLLGAP
jgi:CheY-like chemotaxis protein/HPt (histidine-containing phosphotransfer) domain-containing protein